MEGIFGLLTNVVWTSAGPCAVAGFEQTRARLMAAGQPVAEQVQAQPGVLGGRRGRLEVGDLDQAHLAGDPAYVVRPGQGCQLGRRRAALGRAQPRRGKPRVEHGAALVEGDQGMAPGFGRCVGHVWGL